MMKNHEIKKNNGKGKALLYIGLLIALPFIIGMILIGGLILLLINSCNFEKSPPPSLEEMGEWDGNYFYRDNFKTKSTGEDFEYLVKEINIDGITYNTETASDSYFYDNGNVYMIFSTYKKDSEGVEDYKYLYYVLVKYDIKTKTQEVLYVKDKDISFDRILKVYNSDKIFIEGYYENKKYYISYDISDQTLEIIDKNYFIFYDNFYLAYDINNNLYYSDYENNFTYVTDSIVNSYDVNYYVDNNKDYLIIIGQKGYELYHGNYTLGIFDINTLQYYDLTNNLNEKNFKIYDNKYIVTYKLDYYKEYDEKNTEKSDFKYYASNEIYIIDYSNYTLNHLYTFDNKKIDYSGMVNESIIYNDKMYIEAREFKTNGLFIGSNYKIKEEVYCLDLETLEISNSKKSLSDIKSLINDNYDINNANVNKCNNIEYYFEIKPTSFTSSAYTLYSYDLTTFEVKKMQYFQYQEHSDYIFYDIVRMSQYIFYYDENDGLYRINDIIILNY